LPVAWNAALVFSRWIAEVDVPFNPMRISYLGLKGVARLRTAP
jgi:hypothetical protein